MSSEIPSPWLSGAQAERGATGQDGLGGGGGSRALALPRSRRPAVRAPAVLTSPGGDADRAHNWKKKDPILRLSWACPRLEN